MKSTRSGRRISGTLSKGVAYHFFCSTYPQACYQRGVKKEIWIKLGQIGWLINLWHTFYHAKKNIYISDRSVGYSYPCYWTSWNYKDLECLSVVYKVLAHARICLSIKTRVSATGSLRLNGIFCIRLDVQYTRSSNEQVYDGYRSWPSSLVSRGSGCSETVAYLRKKSNCKHFAHKSHALSLSYVWLRKNWMTWKPVI